MHDNEKNEQVVAVSTAIEKKLAQVVDVPESKRQEVRQILIQSVSKFHRGPIPDPEAMAAYNQHIPNGADRIMTMAEQQSAHRQAQEAKIVASQVSMVETQNTLQLRGQWIAATIALAFLSAAVFLGANGHDWLAGVLGGTTVVGLVTVFVLGRKYGNDEDDESGSTPERESRPPASSGRSDVPQQTSKKRRR